MDFDVSAICPFSFSDFVNVSLTSDFQNFVLLIFFPFWLRFAFSKV